MMRTGRHAAPRRSPWRPLAAAVLGASVLVVAGNGVWAALSATAFNATPQRATSGTLSLTLGNNGAGFSQPVANVAPGDVVHRYVEVANNGTLAGQALTLAVTSSTPGGTLIADTAAGTRALRLSVNSCTNGTWTATSGTCSGTVTPLLPSTVLSALSSPATLVAGAVPAGQVLRLQLTLQLPDQNETTTNGAAPATTIQGQSTELTYTFAETQRTASTTSS